MWRLGFASSTSSLQDFNDAQADPDKKLHISTSFYRYFTQPNLPQGCAQPAACAANHACWQPLFGQQLRGYETEQQAVDFALQ